MKHCCKMMEYYLSIGSEPYMNADGTVCPDSDKIVTYSAPLDEYGIVIHDGGDSSIKIKFCPWCGKKLPESKRDKWIAKLEKMGYDSPFTDDIPAEYRTDAWQRKGKT